MKRLLDLKFIVTAFCLVSPILASLFATQQIELQTVYEVYSTYQIGFLFYGLYFVSLITILYITRNHRKWYKFGLPLLLTIAYCIAYFFINAQSFQITDDYIACNEVTIRYSTIESVYVDKVGRANSTRLNFVHHDQSIEPITLSDLCRSHLNLIIRHFEEHNIPVTENF